MTTAAAVTNTVVAQPERSVSLQRARSCLVVCGDLHNLGDLALLLQAIDRENGRPVLARQWSALPDTVLQQVGRAGAAVLDGRRLLSSLNAARHCDMVIGGGQIVRQNTSLRSLFYLALTAAAVCWSGGKIETRGLGISRTHGIRFRLWRFILRRARTINVRDSSSLSRARALCPGRAVRESVDLVLEGNVAALAHPTAGMRAVVVALCRDASEERDVESARLVALLEEAHRRWPAAPVVAAIHDLRPGADRTAFDRLRALGVNVRVFDEGTDLTRLLALYRDAEIVLTNRLHAGIFASLFGRPLVVLDDGNDKLALLYEDLSGVACGFSREPCEEAPAAVLDRALAPSPADRAQRLAEVRARAGQNGAGPETALFNVKFSPNLGDGIIAECLERGLGKARPGLVARSVDLAGRSRFDARTGESRRALLKVLEQVPAPLRRIAMPAIVATVVRFRLRAGWKEAIASSDSVVIGGGNLLADADQNFPIKVSNVLDLCGRQGVPVAISHVGVSPRWSREGKTRFRAAVARVSLLGVTVRDKRSAANFQDEFGTFRPPVALDPGLLCCDTYGTPDRVPGPGGKRVGICLTDPLVLRLHGEGEVAGGLFKKWLRAVVERALGRGLETVLFTNGSPEDEAFADELEFALANFPGVTRMARFTSPGALARFIGGLDGVVAHRLHACIAAYSYRVPAIGFSWDKKLDSFFDLVARQDYVCDWRSTGPAELVSLLERSLADPPDPAMHANILERCRGGIANLATRLATARVAA